MLSRGFRGNGDQKLVATHAAFADAFDISELRIFLLHIAHDFGPFSVSIISLPANRKIKLTVVAARTFL